MPIRSLSVLYNLRYVGSANLNGFVQPVMYVFIIIA